MKINLAWIEQNVDCQTARSLLVFMRKTFTSIDFIPSRALLNWLRKEGGVEKEMMEAWLLAQNECLTRDFLSLGANPNAARGFALRLAARKGRIDVFEVLLEAGCDIHALGELPLQIAVEARNIPFVMLIIEKGGRECYKGNICLLEIIRIAKKRGFTEIIPILEAAYNGS